MDLQANYVDLNCQYVFLSARVVNAYTMTLCYNKSFAHAPNACIMSIFECVTSFDDPLSAYILSSIVLVFVIKKCCKCIKRIHFSYLTVLVGWGKALQCLKLSDLKQT